MNFRSQTGWSSLELVMLLPLIVGLFGLITYAAQVGFSKLHLVSAVDAGARVAAFKSCSEGIQVVRASFSDPSNLLVTCDPGDEISILATYQISTALPFFELLETKVTAQAHAYNETL